MRLLVATATHVVNLFSFIFLSLSKFFLLLTISIVTAYSCSRIYLVGRGTIKFYVFMAYIHWNKKYIFIIAVCYCGRVGVLDKASLVNRCALSWGWEFNSPSEHKKFLTHPLWRHCNVTNLVNPGIVFSPPEWWPLVSSHWT
jgi:hypothetical protein